MEYLNYASLGFTVGHELTHGFDNIGYQYDADGNLKNWWTNETRKKFEAKFQCFIEQYGNFTDRVSGLKSNGSKTLMENLADNGEEFYLAQDWGKLFLISTRWTQTFLSKLQKISR